METSDWKAEVVGRIAHRSTGSGSFEEQWNCLAGNGIDRNCSWKGSSSMGRPPEVALTDKVASWAQQPVKVYAGRSTLGPPNDVQTRCPVSLYCRGVVG